MTISTTTVSQSYSGNGSTTAFTFPFPINSTSEIKVIERSATGAETVKSVGTGSANYAIVDNGASGGTVTMVTAPAAGTTLVLIRDTSLTQESDYVENDPFAAETHEDALDKLQMQIQEVQEEVDRSMKISKTNTMTSTEFTNSATDRASKVLAFDSSGELSVTQELGSFKGGSATTTTAAYVIRDIVKGTTTAQLNNIYICIQASPIGTALTNTSFWTLIVDAVSAATSATTATTKASEAATSATNAAASLDSFDDRYLGAKSSDPSADNDGDGLATGAIYFKTDGTGFKVYNGSAWKDIRPTDAQQTAIDTVAGANSNISALAASAVITDMALLATTDVIADMALLATSDVISDMNALAVSDVISDINTLATSDIVSDLNTLATSDIVSDINTLATSDIVSDLNTLATSDIVADINTLATSDIVTDLNLLATSDFVSDLNALSTSTNVTNMANLNASGVITNIANLNGSGVVANIATVAGAVSNVNTTAGAIANVNSVASNIASVNNFSEVYRIASSAPSSSLTAGDLYFNTSTNVLNVYGASGWQNAGSSVNGTSQRYHYDISGTPTAVTGNDAAGNTLAYDAGFIDVFLNGVRMSTADVTVTSGDTVTFASALANGDEVDIVAYGTFAVAQINADNLNSGTVPVARVAGSYTGVTGTGALNAGTITSGFGNINTGASTITTTGEIAAGSLDISGNIDVDGTTNLDVVDIDGAVDMASTLNVTGKITADAGIDIDNFNIDGTTIALSSGSITLDAAGRIDLSADDAGEIRLFDGSSMYGQFKDDDDRLSIQGLIQDKDIMIVGNDGGSDVTAVRFDMSEAGLAVFNAGVALGGAGAANTLDDYEEGTWTIILEDVSDRAFTLSSNTGTYIKIGGQVTVTGIIEASAINSASGNCRISGLPFNILGNQRNYSSMVCGYAAGLAITAGTSISGYGTINSNNLNLTNFDATTGTTNLTAAKFSAGGSIIFTFTYTIV